MINAIIKAKHRESDGVGRLLIFIREALFEKVDLSRGNSKCKGQRWEQACNAAKKIVAGMHQMTG